MNEQIERLLASQEPQMAQLTRRLCALILELYPEAVVSVDGGDIGFGSGTGYKGLVFVVAPHGRHVTLGISHGVGLTDPSGLLEGSGKVHRHVKIRDMHELERPELRDLMADAVARHG